MKSSSTIRSSIASQRDSVCRACRIQLARQARSYATTTAEAVASPSAGSQEAITAPTQSTARKAYKLTIAPVVSRPPLLTRELTTFEKAYYLYQKRLNERLALPPTRYFYYPRGTPSDLEWKRKVKARHTAARDIGVYNAYGKEGWQDEVLVGDTTGERDSIIENLFRDAEGRTIIGAELVGDESDKTAVAGDPQLGEGTQSASATTLERPLPRRTKADEAKELRSLDRKLDRSLYLLVKDEDNRWRFPEDIMFGKESLYQAAERILVQAAGVNMNTWVVGNHPIGHYQSEYTEPREVTRPLHRTEGAEPKSISLQEYGTKVFFMKTRIMAGQADLAKNIFGLTDFAWLSKEEVKDFVSPRYWSYISNMLTER